MTQMYKHHDTLTYRFPRTTQEAFGLDPEGAVAIRRYRQRQIRLTKLIVKAGAVAWVGLMTLALLEVI